MNLRRAATSVLVIFVLANLFITCDRTLEEPETAQFSKGKQPALVLLSTGEPGEIPLIAGKIFL